MAFSDLKVDINEWAATYISSSIVLSRHGFEPFLSSCGPARTVGPITRQIITLGSMFCVLYTLTRSAI